MDDLKEELARLKARTDFIEKREELPPLWEHQIKGIERAEHLDYFGFFFEVGTGKSRALIETCESKYAVHGKVLRTLVLTPLIVVENFRREFDKFGRQSKGKAAPLLGKFSDKLKLLKEVTRVGRTPILITNYETLQNKEVMDALKTWCPEILVADELHKLKNPTSLRTKNCQALSDRAKYRFGLSGTPVLNSEMDLFSQVRFLDHGKALGSNFFVFRQQYFYDVNAARRSTTSYFPMWKVRPSAADQLKAKITPFTMAVKKKDALDLPPLVLKEVHLTMDHDQLRCYNEMKKNFITFLKDKAATAELAITKSLRLLQITSGFVKTEDGTEVVFSPSPKQLALEKLLEEIAPTAKSVIWCTFRKNYEIVEGVCNKLGLKFATLHGDTKNRQEEIDRFQTDDETRVIICNAAAAGVGISLTSASYMIFFSKNFNYGDSVQAEARAYRAGSEQFESVTRIDLICSDTIDSIVHSVLKEKEALADKMMSNAEVFMRLKREFGI
jgi:SNF2 family DNA or RNA helicase